MGLPQRLPQALAGLTHQNPLNRWNRLLAQALVTTVIIVVAALISREIYLIVQQPPEAEMEDVGDFDRSTPDCPAPRWERSAPQRRDVERETA